MYSIVLNVLKIENMTLKPYARATMENNAGDYKFLQDIFKKFSPAKSEGTGPKQVRSVSLMFEYF